MTTTFESQHELARKTLLEARELRTRALGLLGHGDNNTNLFIHLLSRYHAAMWRWKRAQSSPLEVRRKSDDFLSL